MNKDNLPREILNKDKADIKFLLKNISYLYHSNEHELCYQEHSLVQQTF